MAKAKCFQCGGVAIADTFDQARKLINHAASGIPCADSCNRVQEIPQEKPKIMQLYRPPDNEKPKPRVISTTKTKEKSEEKPKTVLTETKEKSEKTKPSKRKKTITHKRIIPLS